MHPNTLQIKNFDYTLTEDRIAKFPLAERDLSKLLVYKKGVIEQSIYRDIDTYIPTNSMLVFNNTKVIQARLFFKNSTGATIEIFCLEPAESNADMALAMGQNKTVKWKCLVGKAAKWKDPIIQLTNPMFTLSAQIIERVEDTFIIQFLWQPEQLSFAEILDVCGQLPIPPYLKRDTEEMDIERYQTIYAQHKGSVAAPTAGLHFSAEIFRKLDKKNIIQKHVTLHVGAGTFKPVKSETMQDHTMHAELMDIDISAIENIAKTIESNNEAGLIIAVGTTSLRTLESLYWMGLKALKDPSITSAELEIKQWDAYEMKDGESVTLVLEALLNWMRKNKLVRLICKTQILIAPPYKLKIANGLITNFHQPNSTLLLLVAAVIGENWRKVYAYALDNNFRFLSYGDGSLLFAE